MQLKASWYDNLIAGGLFWLPQLVLSVRFVPDVFPILGEFTEFIKSLPDPVATLLVTAVVALATLLILVTGTILEMLMGSGLPYWEMNVFYRHLILNKDWVQKAIQKHASYIQDDYDTLVESLEPPNIAEDVKDFARRAQKKGFLEKLRLGQAANQLALIAFNRLYALILVRTVSKSSSEPSEVIAGPLQAWRLSRLISSILIVLAIEGVLAFFAEALRVEVPASSYARFFVGLLVLFFVIWLAISFTAKGFERVCLILFSLWYDAEMREDENREPASI